MAKLHILSKAERKAFNSPPLYTADGRRHYFYVNEEIKAIINTMRLPINKVGFILQLGYFKYAGRFFMASQFHKRDVDFVAKLLGIDSHKVPIEKYNENKYKDHQKVVLSLQGISRFNNEEKKLFLTDIDRLVSKKIRPKLIIIKLIDILQKKKIEIPSYNQFADAIVDAENRFESNLISILEKHLDAKQIAQLDALLPNEKKDPSDTEINANEFYQRAPITKLKNIIESSRPEKIKTSVKRFIFIKDLFDSMKNVIDALALSPESRKYYAIWIQKSQTFQIIQRSNRYKRYLYLLAFISHQYYIRQDLLIDTLLKSVQAVLNKVKRKQRETVFDNRKEKDKAIQQLSQSNGEKKVILKQIKQIVVSRELSDKTKIQQIHDLLIKEPNEILHTEEIEEFIKVLDKQVLQSLKNTDYYDLLGSLSTVMQNRASFMLKHLQFNSSTSNTKLITAIQYFCKKDGDIGKNPPCTFLDENEINMLKDENDAFRTSLYKSLLFVKIADAIKAGILNLEYSYRYLSLDEYLFGKELWKSNGDELIKNAGFKRIKQFSDVIKPLKKSLHAQYCKTNVRINTGDNIHITFNKKGKVIVKTPKVNKADEARISELLPQNKFTSILDLLMDIDRQTRFTDCFQHYSVKDKNKRPLPTFFYAGLLGKGCNIGISKLANTSKGISEHTLENVVNWYFSNDTILAANKRILNLVNKLALPNLLKRHRNLLHTSSDGKKRYVSVDSLIANYSFKYFGSEQGVSIYDFIDERHLLFHTNIISSSEREAHYVIDGLLDNEEIKSTIHSTDTHGYTDIIFSIMHLLGISFAPRIAKIKDRVLYSFKSKPKKYYKMKGYKILPSKYINLKLIEENWDDILRFMTSIKLKETTASQVFKRLSSYSKNHPLYKALRELGKITKTLFLLTYMDDVELRQSIQKQLNKIELSNKFSDAVFFANNQEFKQGSKEDQEIAMNCRMLIQNAIVLWNYLYLSQLLANCKDKDQQNEMLKIIKNSSMMTWLYVNFNGEYDFREKISTNDLTFDIDKILGWEAA
ncbi:MAG: Tn3 family transposase [Gammaproteobacteria bacterium]